MYFRRNTLAYCYCILYLSNLMLPLFQKLHLPSSLFYFAPNHFRILLVQLLRLQKVVFLSCCFLQQLILQQFLKIHFLSFSFPPFEIIFPLTTKLSIFKSFDFPMNPIIIFFISIPPLIILNSHNLYKVNHIE